MGYKVFVSINRGQTRFASTELATKRDVGNWIRTKPIPHNTKIEVLNTATGKREKGSKTHFSVFEYAKKR